MEKTTCFHSRGDIFCFAFLDEVEKILNHEQCVHIGVLSLLLKLTLQYLPIWLR